ncbi:trehalase family glycosidase [Streptomyces kunmingensis]|uniref:Trehalase family glycosidase n=1 Tax=Streptomyces kunmingensis TaxID=68225 RepID=A0ABU6C4W7_9ACTN|nr:trehalase family glycosidase [Streptomyces kunmingensis]MEB3958850.1 trehalase family glycosidase [Streptomyces kunmingensis]
MPRRHFLRTAGAAGLAGPALALTAGQGSADAAEGSAGLAPATAAGPPDALPYPTLKRPFAMPGVKDQEWTGALFVGAGEARFALRVGLLTAQGKIIREKMTNYLWRIGPIAPDGAYRQVRVSTDDRTVMPAHLDALREVIAHPDQWSADAVADATTKLPQLQAKYEQTQRERREIRVRHARTEGGDGLVATVTALDDDTTIVLELATPWGEEATFALDGRHKTGMTGKAPGVLDAARTGHISVACTEPADAAGCYASVADMTAAVTGGTGATGTAVAALTYRLDKGESVTFAARIGDRPQKVATPEVHEAERTLAAAEARVRDANLTGSGPVGRAADAVRDALSLNTNYDRDHQRNFVLWGWGGGGGLFTGWDSAFDAIDAALVSRPLALQHETDVFDAAAPPHQVPLTGPRYDQQNAGPMHAYAVWRLYTKFGDRTVLEKAYPALVTFHDLLPEWDTDGDGLLETPYFGDRIGGRGNHLGLDDSPVYADYHRIAKKGGSGDTRDNTDLTDVALNSYYALLAETLAKMARVLDRPADAARFAEQHATIRRLLNDRLWHAEKGLYLSRYLDGTWNEVVTPTVFYPLFAGIATQDRARTLIEDHLLNPDEFWGDHVIPSVARNDPTYCSGGPVHPDSEHFRFFDRYGEDTAPEQWKGAAWPPMNFTVYDGVKRYGFDNVAGQFAARSTAMYLDAWDKENWFPESFDPEPGQSVMDSAVDTAWRTYSWSNAMAVQGLHELLSDNPWDGDPGALMFGSLTLPGTNTVEGVELRGHTYAVSCGPTRTTLARDGRTLFRATGARVAIRDFVLTAKGATFDINADGPARIEVFAPGRPPRGRQIPAARSHVKL